MAQNFIEELYKTTEKFINKKGTTKNEMNNKKQTMIDILYSELFYNNPIQTILVDTKGKVTAFNKAKKNSGDRLPRIGDMMYKDYAANHDLDMHAELLDSINTGKIRKFPDQKYIDKYLSIKITPFKEDAFIMSQDITKRKKYEEALKESEARYKALFDRSHYLIFLHDFKGKLLDVNDAALNLLNYKKDEILNINISSLIDKDFLHIAVNALKKIIEKGYYHSPIEIKIRKKNNDYVWVICEGSIIYRNEQPYAIQGIARDITKQKKADNALRESEEQYRTLVENINIGICRNTVGNGRLLQVNPAMARMLGYNSVEEIMNLRISDIYQDAEDRVRFADELIQTGYAKEREIRLRKKDGSAIIASCSAKVQYSESGDIKWMDTVLEDVTDRKKTEEDLKESFKKLRKTLGSTVQAMALAVESRDPYTAGHQRRVSDLARAIAEEMGICADKIDGLRLAGLIHDLGKITIPAEILSKPGHLSEVEFALIKNHSQIGFDILKSIDFPWPVSQIIYQHHERINASGYPSGLSGDDILIESKILAVSDVVEAMATHRPYRAALGIEKALEEIKIRKGILYDPDVVDACVALFEKNLFVLQV